MDDKLQAEINPCLPKWLLNSLFLNNNIEQTKISHVSTPACLLSTRNQLSMYPSLEPVTHMSLVTCSKSPSLGRFLPAPPSSPKIHKTWIFSLESPCHDFHLLRRKYDILWPQQALAIGQSPLTCTWSPLASSRILSHITRFPSSLQPSCSSRLQ